MAGPPRWVPTPAVRASLWLHGAGLLALGAAPGVWPWVLGVLAADHAVLGLVGMRPRSTLLGPNLSRLPPASAARGEVALTFDDGPHPGVTPRVLDLLETAGATASFFLIGERATRHPALVREILRRGHDVQNHTQTHPLSFALRGPFAQRREILRAQAALMQAGAEAPRFFRPPAGLRNPLLDPVLAGAGLGYVSWTRRGADALLADADRVLRRLLQGLAAGDILLLHDGTWRKDAAGQPVILTVLPRLLAALDAAGLRGVSLTRALAGPLRPEVQESLRQQRSAA
ncbi:polysaccharide deacetylase family protein [Roseomonas sp. OT10]|uniref:polysaccharide deacetylase family protein n=1 Tax=Roseomonas cutis TaxID=2897332 RepID=UPI001E637C56|nr:polysaccharide deacetylase family protein [Roseomonas sp. OT10]UFN47992.1 polysaccharide deacetylase family protein [Roseomonas sp. OT10]